MKIAIIGSTDIGRIHKVFVACDVDVICADGKEIHKDDFYDSNLIISKCDYEDYNLLESLDELRDPYDCNSNAKHLFIKLKGDEPCILKASGGCRIRAPPNLAHNHTPFKY